MGKIQIPWKWVIKSLPGLLLGLLMWASQVTPQQASSNMASWLIFFGVAELPTWVTGKAIDKWVFWGGLIGLLGWGIFLWERYRKRGTSQAIRTTTKTSEEIDNDHYQNNHRKGALKIEFSNDYTFKSIGPSEGHGLQAGHWQTYRVRVRNTTEQAIVGVQVWLKSISPMPSELMGHGVLPLHITHESPGVNTVTLTSNEERFVDVVSFIDKFWNSHIRIEHTSSVANQEIYKGDDGYEIELVAKGNTVEYPFRRRFKIGVNGQDLYMRSLDQPAEEAMAEGYRDA